MKYYNVRDLLLWIQTTAVHPANQLFHLRFELLLGLLFSIPPEKFQGHPLTRRKFNVFIKDFETKSSDQFRMVEDYQPFNQLKLIPYFSSRKKYYFFYAGLERPYEYLRQFEDIFLMQTDGDSYTELMLLKRLFILSLEYQTRILEKMSLIGDSKTESESLYVPTQQFYNDISPLFKMDRQHYHILKEIPSIKPGDFTAYDEKKLYLSCLDIGLFSTLSVMLSNADFYYTTPQVHLKALYDFTSPLINKSDRKRGMQSLIFKQFVSRLQQKCLQFFTIRKILAQVLKKGTNQNLAASADIIARIDANKVFLFKATEHSYEFDSSRQVEKAMKELTKTIDVIKKEDIIGLHYLDDDEIIGVPVDKMEFWSIVVYESGTFDCKIDLPSDIVGNDSWIVHMLDLQSIFEFLSSDLALVKFLRADRELLSKTRAISADYLDRFSYYISNGESYSTMGRMPDMVYFSPHSWNDFYHEKLFEKYQDNIYELIEYDFPRTFNYVRKYIGDSYEVFNTRWLNGGYVVKYGDNLVWIMFPTHEFNCTAEEIELFSRLVGPLLADYLNRLREPLLKFFKGYNFEFQVKYRIGLYPASLVKRSRELQYLRPYIAQLQQKNPFLIVTKRLKDTFNIRSYILYDTKYLIDLFSPKENIGERFCIKKLIESLVHFFDPTLSESERDIIAQEFVNLNVPVSVKGYSVEPIPTLNPKLNEYKNYQSFSNADIAIVNREIAEYLSNSGEKPGEYHGDEAKRLNNLIFQFLQKKLEEEIRQFNKNLLLYAYKEVELLEGWREICRIKSGMDADKYTRYDVVQKHTEKMSEISNAANSAKYIIESILKVQPSGERTINDESWQYLQSISLALHDVSINSDLIHYQLVPQKIIINDLFEIDYVKGPAVLNLEEFNRIERRLKIELAKQTLANRINSLVSDVLEKKDDLASFSDEFNEVSEAFRAQFGFSFINFSTMLYILGCMNCFYENLFPLSLIPEQILVSKLKEKIKNPLSKADIKKMLDFACLSFSSYQPDDELIPTKLLRRKERVNLCPLVKLKSGEYLYGNQMCLSSLGIWHNSILSADFPYSLQQNSPIAESLKKYHEYLDHQLEKEAEDIAKKTLGRKNVAARIKNFKEISQTLPSTPSCGEIDVLAVNKKTRAISVLEAKNVNRKLIPAVVRRELDYFFSGTRQYLQKLTQKQEFISNHLKEVLNHFGVHDASGWKVRKAFVVNENYPSAYCPDQTVDFVLLDKLSNYLTKK